MSLISQYVLALAHDVSKEMRDESGRWSSGSIHKIKSKVKTKGKSKIKSVTRIKPSNKHIKKLAAAAKTVVFKSVAIATGTDDAQVEAAAMSIAHAAHRLKGKKELLTKVVSKIKGLHIF